MKAARIGSVLGACIALVSCATAPQKPDPVLTGRTQELAVRTDAPGASCSFMQDGKVVVSVESTPGTASVPRDFRRLYVLPPPLEGIKPLELVC